jgi:DNA-binding transcriptional LysR family regulator
MAGVRSKWVGRRNIALRDLSDEPWVLPPTNTAMGTHIVHAFRAAGLQPPRSQVMSFSIPLCHNLLASGGFLTIFPVMMTRLAANLNLRPLDTQFPRISRAFVLMTLRGRTLNPLAEVFISCARDMAKDIARGGDALGKAGSGKWRESR